MDTTAGRSRHPSAARAHLDRGFRFEQGGSLDRALEEYGNALAAHANASEQIEARLRVARVYRTMAEWEKSSRESSEAIRLANEIGADDLAAEAMNVQIGALQVRGLFDEADALGLEAMERAKSARVRGITLQNLGRGAAERRDFALSDRYFEESIAAFREADYDIGLAVALTNSAKAALDRGDARTSIEAGQEAVTLARRLNLLDVLLSAVQNQAAALAALGNLDSAESLLAEALGHFTSARNLVSQAECLEIMGQMSESRGGDPETAHRCYSRARELAIASGNAPLVERLNRRLEDLAIKGHATGRASLDTPP